MDRRVKRMSSARVLVWLAAGVVACGSPAATSDGPTGDASAALPPDLARPPDLAWLPDLVRAPEPDLAFTAFDAGHPPVLPCGGDAAVPDGGVACAPPPSECADSSWLVYFTDGQCVLGTCRWQRKFLDCGGDQKICRDGACEFGFTM